METFSMDTLRQAIRAAASRQKWSIGAVDLGNQAKVNAVADAVACLAGLLEVAQIDDATEDALLAAFPPTLQAAQRAREAGHDVQASVSAIALHMWHQLRPEDLQQ
jgi:alpha-D-ribose 1-methylphosphonate 5-triphosphate diphosphatase PhnM